MFLLIRIIYQLYLGSSTVTSFSFSYEGNEFQIYDKDRLICDCLKYESKMNREDFKEALQSYIKDEDKDNW